MRTEIENILEGLPYDFLIDNADKAFASIKALYERDTMLIDTCIMRNIYVYKDGAYFLYSWGFDWQENRTIFIETLPVTIEAIKRAFEDKLENINTVLDAIRRSEKENSSQ